MQCIQNILDGAVVPIDPEMGTETNLAINLECGE